MENIDIYKRRLFYKGTNRGWKETDLLLGGFLNKYIHSFEKAELLMLDLILDEPDSDIFNWMTKKIEVPAIHNNHVMYLLQNFKLHNN